MFQIIFVIAVIVFVFTFVWGLALLILKGIEKYALKKHKIVLRDRPKYNKYRRIILVIAMFWIPIDMSIRSWIMPPICRSLTGIETLSDYETGPIVYTLGYDGTLSYKLKQLLSSKERKISFVELDRRILRGKIEKFLSNYVGDLDIKGKMVTFERHSIKTSPTNCIAHEKFSIALGSKWERKDAVNKPKSSICFTFTITEIPVNALIYKYERDKKTITNYFYLNLNSSETLSQNGKIVSKIVHGFIPNNPIIGRLVSTATPSCETYITPEFFIQTIQKGM